eukprot:Plantae.Rhodophyta-Rhodochaete_pulchella.ctg11426.p1 GENE.Plantae.Rhodophyta-Rhodochaete_pulchella.ctg11426~~Plantae.Rhodophyta-Rhodochaete_pulchella.ctg11426.p1  ORF type:complete len:364 (-),score=45.75 Plantae.Rhodophyta-Rhodochaete_pulchella.ctg11426:321-1304(-)
MGVNFIDTAEIYPVPSSAPGWASGTTEKYMGTWLARNPEMRSKIIIATKIAGYLGSPSETVANRTDPPGEPRPARLDRQSVLQACDGSLRRLQTDYIDLYQVHWPSRILDLPVFGRQLYTNSMNPEDIVPIEDTLAGLKELLDSGKIRHYGLSNETAFGVGEWIRKADAMGMPRPVSIQNEFHLCNRSFEEALVESCSPNHYNIGLLPWSPLGGGRLTGKYADGSAPESARFSKFPVFQKRFSSKWTDEGVRAYREIAKEAGVSMTTLALAWCASRSYVASTIFGATTIAQLKENLEAFDYVPTEEVLEKVDKVHFARRNPTLILVQ